MTKKLISTSVETLLLFMSVVLSCRGVRDREGEPLAVSSAINVAGECEEIVGERRESGDL